MNRDKILVIEDDQRISRLISRYLERAGYIAETANNGIEMHRLLSEDRISLILMDIMLPGKNGLELAQELRQISDIPIIFLTARADITDKVSGLEIGADDYITKPFEEKELLARIQSVLRRAKADSNYHKQKSLAHFAGWTLNLIDQVLYAPTGEEVEITSYEYQVLTALIKRANAIISRNEILNILSGREWSPLDRSADMAISKLRKKIERNPKKPTLIRTIRNKGYQLTTAVEFKDFSS